MVAAAAMAASSALPPACIAATPLCEARTCGEATIPRGAWDSSQRVVLMQRFYRAIRAGNRSPRRGYSRVSHVGSGRVASEGGVCSGCVTRSPDSQPSGLRAGRGGPTPPEHTPPSDDRPRPVSRSEVREYFGLVAELPDRGGDVLQLVVGQFGIERE